jgi:hypothetical protein
VGDFLNKKPTLFYLLETLKKSNLGKKNGIYLNHRHFLFFTRREALEIIIILVCGPELAKCKVFRIYFNKIFCTLLCALQKNIER